jgi:hypothetical protein
VVVTLVSLTEIPLVPSLDVRTSLPWSTLAVTEF